jgi:hypothetical protein
MSVSAMLLSLALFAASPAGSGPYVLSYRAPEGCPTEDQMSAAITAHVRNGTRPSGVRIEIEIVTVDGRFAGALVATDRFGSENRQSVDGSNCGEIARALAFLAGLAVELGERRQEDVVSTGAPPAAQPAGPPPHSFRITGRILAGVTGGLADVPSLMGEVGIVLEDIRPRVFAPALEGAILVAGDSQIDGQRGSAELSLFGGRLAVCPARLSKSKAELRPCAGVAFGEVWGRATSLTNAPTVTEPWLSAEATLAVRWFFTSQILGEVEGGAVFPLVRPSYSFEFQPVGQPLYTVPRVTGRIAAGVGFRF